MTVMGRWRDKHAERFRGRAVKTVEEIARAEEPPFSTADVEALALAVRDEFGVELGSLRADDPIELLVSPPSAGLNPLRWMVYESWSRDAANSIHARLAARLREYGTHAEWPVVRTAEELLLAWCGRRPRPH